jgi:hypothetical protein
MSVRDEDNGVTRSCNLDEISERIQAADPNESTAQIIEDRKALLNFVEEQAAKLAAVRRLADDSVGRISPYDVLAALEQSFEDESEISK